MGGFLCNFFPSNGVIHSRSGAQPEVRGLVGLRRLSWIDRYQARAGGMHGSCVILKKQIKFRAGFWIWGLQHQLHSMWKLVQIRDGAVILLLSLSIIDLCTIWCASKKLYKTSHSVNAERADRSTNWLICQFWMPTTSRCRCKGVDRRRRSDWGSSWPHRKGHCLLNR